MSQKSCLILYLRCSVSEDGAPVTVFLDLLELDALNADSILTSLKACLHSCGLSDDVLHECLLGFASDGASVMLGKQGGVYAKLKAEFPHLMSWHCFNHRLELSVHHDAIAVCTEINHFQVFMQKL